MPRKYDDTTIEVGMRLFDGADFDTVVERVAYGGFGVIAFGKNRMRNNRMTAYKTLRRDLLKDPQTRAGFVRECLLWKGLWPHPNVADATAVLEMGDAQGLRPFLALAYAEHGSLRDLLDVSRSRPEGRPPLELALILAQQIAAGLAYLHRPDPAYLRTEPTVHRDLKPENVLLMEDGRVVITDFGLAKAVEESPTAVALLLDEKGQVGETGIRGQQAEEAILIGSVVATQTTSLRTGAGVALGTIAYMPPEQWEDARFAGTPADIYALGIMLSEIFAGRHALLDLTQSYALPDWQRAHHDPRPRSLREVAPEVPEVIEAIYQRCLARDAEDRPAADAVLAALQTGARAAGFEAYTPSEHVPHSPRNEWVHWLLWSNACYRFMLYADALARNDRAIELAQRFTEDGLDLPATLLTRGTILKEMGAQALADGNATEAARLDQQVEMAFQESLATRPPATTPEGQRGRAMVWNQIGAFNNERQRYAYSEDAYGRALALTPDNPGTYFNRAKNQAQWGLAEMEAGHRDAAIAHLRQARVYAVTALGMNDPIARGLLHDIEEVFRQLGVTE